MIMIAKKEEGPPDHFKEVSSRFRLFKAIDSPKPVARIFSFFYSHLFVLLFRRARQRWSGEGTVSFWVLASPQKEMRAFFGAGLFALAVFWRLGFCLDVSNAASMSAGSSAHKMPDRICTALLRSVRIRWGGAGKCAAARCFFFFFSYLLRFIVRRK